MKLRSTRTARRTSFAPELAAAYQQHVFKAAAAPMTAETWSTAASILKAVSLDRDSLHQLFTSVAPPRAGLTTMSAKKRKNSGANRYANILPYDHNGVKVMTHAEEGSRGRFINASLLQVRCFCKTSKECIACVRMRALAH